MTRPTATSPGSAARPTPRPPASSKTPARVPTSSRDIAERDASVRLQEAEAVYEEQRARAAKAAADFETTLAGRRQAAEQEFTQKMAESQARLDEAAQLADRTRTEAEDAHTQAGQRSPGCSTRPVPRRRRSSATAKPPPSGSGPTPTVSSRPPPSAATKHQRPAGQRAADAGHPDRHRPDADHRAGGRRAGRRADDATDEGDATDEHDPSAESEVEQQDVDEAEDDGEPRPSWPTTRRSSAATADPRTADLSRVR